MLWVRRVGGSLVALAVMLVGTMAVQAGPVNVGIYGTISPTPTGITYSNFVGSFTADDVKFASDTGFNWHPFGLTTNWGADITGNFFVGSASTYTFALNSDDGSRLFIDNVMVVDNGGDHGPMTVANSVHLSAGVHPFEIQFKETGGGESGIDLHVPENVRFIEPFEKGQAPEPTSLVLLGVGGLGLLGYGWRRRKA